jgi:hypothetical protein
MSTPGPQESQADDVPLVVGEVVGADQRGACASMNAFIAELPKTIPTAHIVSFKGCPSLPDHLHFPPAPLPRVGQTLRRDDAALAGRGNGRCQVMRMPMGVTRAGDLPAPVAMAPKHMACP